MSESQPQNPRPEPALKLPAKVIVSLRAGVVLAIANVICVIIFAAAWTHIRTPQKTIAKTGNGFRNARHFRDIDPGANDHAAKFAHSRGWERLRFTPESNLAANS